MWDPTMRVPGDPDRASSSSGSWRCTSSIASPLRTRNRRKTYDEQRLALRLEIADAWYAESSVPKHSACNSGGSRSSPTATSRPTSCAASTAPTESTDAALARRPGAHRRHEAARAAPQEQAACRRRDPLRACGVTGRCCVRWRASWSPPPVPEIFLAVDSTLPDRPGLVAPDARERRPRCDPRRAARVRRCAHAVGPRAACQEGGPAPPEVQQRAARRSSLASLLLPGRGHLGVRPADPVLHRGGASLRLRRRRRSPSPRRTRATAPLRRRGHWRCSTRSRRRPTWWSSRVPTKPGAVEPRDALRQVRPTRRVVRDDGTRGKEGPRVRPAAASRW